MIGRLTLSDFRNHADALIVPDHGFILLTGDNGAGKTNILEAVSMLAPGRGLRGAALRAMARQDGPGGFGIAAEVDGVVLGTGVVAATPDRRQVRIGGVASSANALADHLSIVWLTPAMDRLFLDSPGGRRRFLDRLTLALHPAHAAHSARYDAAMRARNRLLTDQRRADHLADVVAGHQQADRERLPAGLQEGGYEIRAIEVGGKRLAVEKLGRDVHAHTVGKHEETAHDVGEFGIHGGHVGIVGVEEADRREMSLLDQIVQQGDALLPGQHDQLFA